MKNYTLTFLISLILASVGCKTTTVTPISTLATKKMDRGAKVYVTIPCDGSYGNEKYPGSGNDVAAALEAAFARYDVSVAIGEQTDAASEAIGAAKLKECQYLVIPKIIHWEDRATEWSGVRDKMGLFIKVVLVKDGSEVRSAEISGKSSWFTFGGDHPQDLLKAPIQQFIGSLF